MRVLSLLVLALAVNCVFGDVYMHAPRGSNNRYRGDQNNNNRLFDSQNNNNGGYGWGPAMTYYTQSLLQVEWTQQHGCGTGHNNVDCEIILQYQCAPWFRDGTADQQVPENVETLPLDQQLEYGYHETAGYYEHCQTRRRNAGVFQADQNANPNQAATQTRQNNNRNGLECAEERDYYPYWHPSIWKDVAILTSSNNQLARCKYYRENTQNTVPKNYCLLKDTPDPATFFDPKDSSTYKLLWQPGTAAPQNNKDACKAAGNEWYEVRPWGIPEPECLEHPLARDNHLGNTDYGAMTARYLWTLPKFQDMSWDDNSAEQLQATCVFRLRYNVTTEDYKGWGHIDEGATIIDAKLNGENSPVQGDPEVNFGRDEQGILRNLTLAIDTAQFGRTFQDRSHIFYIKPAPAWVLPSQRIFNLNVRGKRGNIVQAYPSVEYDFTPNQLRISRDDLLHIQWTGSDTNPQGNAGEGTQRTDRNNIVQLADNGGNARKNYPMEIEKQTMFDMETAFKLAHLDQPSVCLTATQTACCKTYEQLVQTNGNNADDIQQDVQNCGKLNSAPAYFNAGLVKMGLSGTFHYMSTRNNNFSNRSQKATIYVSDKLPPVAMTAVVAGSAAFVGAAVVAGGVMYSKMHAGSSVANIFQGVKI